MLAGEANAIDAELVPRVMLAILGAAGTEAATKELEADEAVPVPIAFTARTVHVYALPFVSPVTTQVRPLVVVHVSDVGWPVTV